MSLFDFFFPEQAQAAHLRQLASSQRTRARSESRRRTASDQRLESLEDDVGYLALVLGALLRSVDEKGVVTREEVRETVLELDAIDGVRDGKLDVNVLRGIGEA